MNNGQNDRPSNGDLRIGKFFEGTIALAIGMSGILLMVFRSPLTIRTLEINGLSIPYLIVYSVFVTTALLITRPLTDRLNTENGYQLVKLFAYVGLCIAPFGLMTTPPPAISIIAIATLSIGTVSALVIYCNYLCDFDHIQLVAIISFVALISLFTTCIFILASVSFGFCIVASAALNCLGITICCRIADRTPLFRVSAAESEERATTRNIDRFTYCLIGIDFGFSCGFIILSASVFQASTPNSTSMEALALLIPALFASTLLLFFRNQHQYAVEHLSKDYLSASITICLAAAMLAQDDIRLIAIAVVLFLASSQMLIAINASVEFIRCENLSPIWYMAEDGFIALGFAIGLCFAWWASGYSLAEDDFAYASLAIIVINVSLQPQINKGRYPLLISQSSPILRAQAAQSSAQTTEEKRLCIDSNDVTRSDGSTDETAPSVQSEDHADFKISRNSGALFSMQSIIEDSPKADSEPELIQQANPSHCGDSLLQHDDGSVLKPSFTANDITPAIAAYGNGSGHKKGSYQKKIDYISNVCNLSPRQHQILGYLARGRDARFIEEKFCISHSTAKSHIYNIYGKLNVHSKQELIDKIEHTQVPRYRDDPE